MHGSVSVKTDADRAVPLFLSYEYDSSFIIDVRNITFYTNSNKILIHDCFEFSVIDNQPNYIKKNKIVSMSVYGH